VITPFLFSERTAIDQVDFWSYLSTGPVDIMIQTVADVGVVPAFLNTAPFVYSARSGPDIHASLFGLDPNCNNPLDCAYYSGSVTLRTPFIAEAGVAYYFRSSVNLLIGFQTVGLPSGASWQTKACDGIPPYCPAIGGAFVLHGEAAPVPEPGTLVLLGSGLLYVRVARTRKFIGYLDLVLNSARSCKQSEWIRYARCGFCWLRTNGRRRV